MMKKGWIKMVLVLAAVILAGSFISSLYSKDEGEVDLQAKPVREWQEKNPGRPVVTWAEGDLNNDGEEDLVIIYRQNKKCFSQVLLKNDEDYHLLKDMPAPAENQQIQFKNIDDKLPVELIISGMKGSDVGYGIYRVEDGKLINLFEENMDKCC